eukprot:6476495-Amphidinium_carterae.1
MAPAYGIAESLLTISSGQPITPLRNRGQHLSWLSGSSYWHASATGSRKGHSIWIHTGPPRTQRIKHPKGHLQTTRHHDQ